MKLLSLNFFSNAFKKNDLVIYGIFASFFSLYLSISFHKVEYGNAILMASFSDINSYLAIASIESPYELKLLLSQFPYHHLVRWIPHYLVGFFIKLCNASPFEVYRNFLYLLLLFNIFLVYQLKTNILNRICYLGFILFAPYAFISWLYAPAMFADALFYTAMIALSVGLINGEMKYFYLAFFLGALSRQTFFLFIPIYLVYIFFESKNKQYPYIFLIYTILLILFILLINNFLLGEDKNNSNFMILTGLYQWILTPNIQDIGMFFENIGAFLLSISPLMVLKNKFRWDFFKLIYFFILASQPILAGPFLTGGNAARLISLGIPLLAMQVLSSNIKFKEGIFFTVLIMINCLHHNYSFLFVKIDRLDFLNLLIFTTILSFVYFFYDKYFADGTRH